VKGETVVDEVLTSV